MDQGMGLDVVPSLTANRQRTFVPSDSENNFEPSLDIFYKVTPSLNASLTINTDFSATEVDDRQVNLSRFSLFFPEKRDFFLNDSDLFTFGRISDITNELHIRAVSELFYLRRSKIAELKGRKIVGWIKLPAMNGKRCFAALLDDGNHLHFSYFKALAILVEENK